MEKIKCLRCQRIQERAFKNERGRYVVVGVTGKHIELDTVMCENCGAHLDRKKEKRGHR